MDNCGNDVDSGNSIKAQVKTDEDEKVYIEMSLGFRKKDKCLKLKKTLYGLHQSPRMFWNYLTKAMNDVGMVTSQFDPCMFIGDRVIVVAFVDDILFWSMDGKFSWHLE